MADRKLPDQFYIPPQALKEWVGLQPHQEFDFAITKQDIDNLYFAIDKSIRAQDFMHACVIHLSNGRTEEANEALFQSQTESVEAQNRLRQFLLNLILTATRGPNKNG